MGVGVAVFVGEWALFLAVNIKVVEGRNMSNVCALNRSQKQCFMMFYSISSVYSNLCCVELSSCPFIVWNSSDLKDKFSFYIFIINNIVLLYSH